LPIVSIDIPSGWDVEKGPQEGSIREPEVLVSLTAPKWGVIGFSKKHVLGGRFVPKEMAISLNLPKFSGTSQIVELN
jgi:NAD(P)H-hydrate epimerase